MKNLDKLMKVIDTLIENEDKYPIDMRNMRSLGDGEDVSFVDKHNCGTVGCILGWCPVVGDSELEAIPDDFYVYSRLSLTILDWNKYDERVFDLSIQEWDWLFGMDHPNSALAAKKRLQYLMNYGLPSNPYDIEQKEEDGYEIIT